jgi:L-amino acid N-acyltransferase YncA
MRPRIRAATENDLDEIATIYRYEVRHGLSTFDLEPPPIGYWIERLASGATGDHLIVADEGGKPVGFAYSSAYRPRPAYQRTRESSVYLDADSRGRGLGRALYDDLLSRLAIDEIHMVVALVATPNPASEALHRACGFRHLGTMTEVGYKFGRWIDTAWFEKRLT